MRLGLGLLLWTMLGMGWSGCGYVVPDNRPDLAGLDFAGVDLIHYGDRCFDGVKDDAESDVDCGGGCATWWLVSRAFTAVTARARRAPIKSATRSLAPTA